MLSVFFTAGLLGATLSLIGLFTVSNSIIRAICALFLLFGVASVMESGGFVVDDLKKSWLGKRIKRRGKPQDILKKGGPRTLKDYLLFFPLACHRCGSRRLFLFSVFVEGREGQLDGAYSDYTPAKYGELWKCSRCGHERRGGWSVFSEIEVAATSTNFRREMFVTDSPYLTSKEAETISEFPRPQLIPSK